MNMNEYEYYDATSHLCHSSVNYVCASRDSRVTEHSDYWTLFMILPACINSLWLALKTIC